MDNKRDEMDRKRLNRKLLIGSFISEMKSGRKMGVVEYIVDFVGVFVALYLSRVVEDALDSSYWVVELAITFGFIVVMLSIGAAVNRVINKVRGKKE